MLGKLLNFIKKGQAVEVSFFDKVELAVLGAESALSVFENLMKELRNSNEILNSVVTDCDALINEHIELQNKATQSTKANEALITNIEKLIGGTK